MKIGYVTQWFPPEPGTLVAAAIADGLAARGHQVEVLTGFPNYPDGKLHRGYRRPTYRREQRSAGVTVHRAPLIPSHSRSSVMRAANYLSWAASATWVARRHLPAVDRWLVYSSPATAALPALLAPGDRPTHLIIQDLWPDSVTESGMAPGRAGRTAAAALHRLCDWSYRRSTGIGVISPSMRAILVDRGVDPRKIAYTPNWVDAPAAADPISSAATRAELGLPDGRLFMYAGNMGELQGLEPLVRAFASVPAARLVLIGAGVERTHLEHLIRRERIDNVTVLDPQPSDRIGRFIAASDIQVVSLKDTSLLRATMPSKLQSSLAAGKPILVHGAGDVAAVVSDHELGLTCDPGDRCSTVGAIDQLTRWSPDRLVSTGRRARTYFDEVFAAPIALDRLETLLRARPVDRLDGSPQPYAYHPSFASPHSQDTR